MNLRGFYGRGRHGTDDLEGIYTWGRHEKLSSIVITLPSGRRVVVFAAEGRVVRSDAESRACAAKAETRTAVADGEGRVVVFPPAGRTVENEE